ncbi:MAG: ABC transporter permease [Synergistaceae bacterium]|jgi:peptide/nickel transport system permease protein|nr:ABC transporter permease [Synergistaceae bacterium]
MKSYITDKLLQYILVLAVSSVIVFVMVRLNPTDPVAVILGGRQTTPETAANIRREYNLDKSVFEQYRIWVIGVLRGDFGVSFKYRRAVTSLIRSRISVTAGIVILSSLISIIIAIPTGILTALKQHSAMDTCISLLQLFLVACPPFLSSILIIWIITLVAPSFPFIGSFSTFGQFLRRISLPSLALSFSMIALTSRVMKSSMIEQLQMNYRTVAVSKGLGTQTVVSRHCLKNAIIPVITILGTQMGNLIVGSVLVENVFSLAGIGSILIDGVKSSDYPLVQSITMMLVFVYMTISTVLDILYGVIDPRIRVR